ncbi:transcriptional regulator [Spirochaetia bacterium]|nr:transcriptional regulator [Spirochaetia bacterium]
METIRKTDGFRNEFLFVFPGEFLAQITQDEMFHALTVTDIGYFPSAHYHFRQRPAGCETAILMYCSAGSGFYSVNGGEQKTLSAKQLILIPPNTPHVYGASNESPWSIYWVHFKGSIVAPYYQTLSGLLPAALSDVFGERLREMFQQCFTMLKTPLLKEEYFYLCQMVGTMLAMVPCAGKDSMLQLSSGSRRLEKTIAFMKNHLHDMISLDELASAAGCSRSHLNYLFKGVSGHSPVMYFLHQKMQAASRDLFFSTLPVKDIALSYGIEDPYYFSRIFKKIMGVSPRQYRSQIKG